jgi:putative spermidine/putrescine transport system ATP-binding protein/putrescine transport system ATP-binding protein
MTFMSRVANALEMAGVSKSFGGVTAVDDVSFIVPKGRITCLLGPSGCGKTTTLRLIAGFEFPDRGTVSVDGRIMTRERPYERNVGLLFQDYALFPHMTVAGNIAYGLKHRSFPKDRIEARSRQMIELVKLGGLERRYPHQLSGGQQQRVALARALAPNPAILLLDEPLSALDAKLRDQLRVELKDILAAVNTTTIVVTHDQEEAMGLGDSIIVMNDGGIAQEGTPAEIYSRPANRFVAQFVGRSNWMAGEVVGQDGASRAVVRLGNGTTVRSRKVGRPPGQRCEVFIRPENLAVVACSNGPASPPHQIGQLTGRVYDVSLLGSDAHVSVDADGIGRLVAILNYQRAARLRRGEAVRLDFDEADTLVFAADGT